mgnify:CR=1 FL=1
MIERFCADHKIDSDKTFRDLSDKEKQLLLYGESTENIRLDIKS